MIPPKLPRKLFHRIGDGYSYMPANAEGWASLAAFVLTALVAIATGVMASEWMESDTPFVIGWIAAAAIFVKLMRFARNHS